MLGDISVIAQIVSSLAVVLSLFYVGLQLRQAAAQMKRSEYNATHEQFHHFRAGIIGSRDLAAAWLKGMGEASTPDAVGELQHETLFDELFWAYFHIWDRSERDIVDKAEWLRYRPGLMEVLGVPPGRRCWERNKPVCPPPFVSEMEALLRGPQNS